MDFSDGIIFWVVFFGLLVLAFVAGARWVLRRLFINLILLMVWWVTHKLNSSKIDQVLMSNPNRDAFRWGLRRAEGLPYFSTDTDPLCWWAKKSGVRNASVFISSTILSEGCFVIQGDILDYHLCERVGEVMQQWLLDYHKFDLQQLLAAEADSPRIAD